jgi:hypothetical protein
MGNPYYGAVLATRALAGISQVTQLDDGTSDFAAYGLYAGTTLAKVLLINTQYYTSGTRPTQAFTLTNLPGSTGSGIRLCVDDFPCHSKSHPDIYGHVSLFFEQYCGIIDCSCGSGKPGYGEFTGLGLAMFL